MEQKENKCGCPHCGDEIKNGCRKPDFCKPCGAAKDEKIKKCQKCEAQYAAEYDECPSCKASGK